MTKNEKDLKRRLDRMTANFNFVYGVIAELHSTFNLPVRGGWQSMVEQVKELRP